MDGMKKNFLMKMLVVLWTIFPASVFSQQVKIISATKQGWAAGVCCRSGVNYNIQLQFFNMKERVELDSLWIDGNCVVLSKYNNKDLKKSDSCYVIIQEGVSWDDGMPMENWCFDATKAGVLISYYIKGKKKWLNITPYIKELEFLAYP